MQAYSLVASHMEHVLKDQKRHKDMSKGAGTGSSGGGVVEGGHGQCRRSKEEQRVAKSNEWQMVWDFPLARPFLSALLLWTVVSTRCNSSLSILLQAGSRAYKQAAARTTSRQPRVPAGSRAY